MESSNPSGDIDGFGTYPWGAANGGVAASYLRMAAPGGQCVECHKKITPSIVSDWQLSKHSQNDVDCSTCHGNQHTSAEDVVMAQIPTPETFAVCHETHMQQFKKW